MNVVGDIVAFALTVVELATTSTVPGPDTVVAAAVNFLYVVAELICGLKFAVAVKAVSLLGVLVTIRIWGVAALILMMSFTTKLYGPFLNCVLLPVALLALAPEPVVTVPGPFADAGS